ncbi:MAG: serine/threonine protein kinase [Kofleriaceae bacterium]|nr:serine/threonine protein kinase [Kofleriaceae bacterium]
MPEIEINESTRLFCNHCKSIYRTGFEHCPNDQTLLTPLVDDPMLGVTLGTHYVIDKCVGEGAMGRVYLAHHARLTKRKFAIKILLGELAADPTMRMRFSQEAEAASRLQHPNVVPVLDYGKTDEGLLYLVMDFVEGEPLSTRLSRGPLSENEVISYCKELCLGLTHAHEHGLVHRDFKPENVVLVKTDQKVTPRILDFGLAIITSTEESSVRLTSAGMVVGTPAYVSPEQARALPVDRRTDLFALGVSMYEMTVGMLPFDGGVIEILYSNATQDPPAFADRNPEIQVSSALEKLVLKLMARELDARFQTAAEVYEALCGIEATASKHNTQQIVSAQIALREMESARTVVPSPGQVGTISVSDIPLVAEEKSNKKAFPIWAIGAVLLLAGGAFAYTQLGGTAKDDGSGAKVTRVEANTEKAGAEVLNAATAPEVPVVVETVDAAAGETEGTAAILSGEPVESTVADAAVVEPILPNEASDNKAKRTVRTKVRGTKRPDKDSDAKNRDPKTIKDSPLAVEKIPEKPEVKPAVVIPPVVPEKPVVKPVVKTPVRLPPPKPKNFDATPSISGLSVKGLSSRDVKRGIDRRMASLRTCYQSASKRSNKVTALSVRVSFVIDEAKRPTQIKVSGASLAGLGSCITSSVKKVQSRNAPDTGVARVSFSIKYAPN